MLKSGSWWQRNRNWAIPTIVIIVIFGFLFLLAAIFFGGIVGFIGLIFYYINTQIKDSGAFQEAMQRVRTNPQIIEYMGEPIQSDIITNGKFNKSNDHSTTRFQVRIYGPKGEGSLYVEAFAAGGIWTFQKMYVILTPSQKVIDLKTQPILNAGLKGKPFWPQYTWHENYQTTSVNSFINILKTNKNKGHKPGSVLRKGVRSFLLPSSYPDDHSSLPARNAQRSFPSRKTLQHRSFLAYLALHPVEFT